MVILGKAEILKDDLLGVGDHFGDADLALGLIRGILEHGFDGQAGVRDVITHAAEDMGGVGAGVDAGDVEFRERFDVAEDRFQLGLEGGDFRIGEFEAGKIGDVTDIDVAVRHGRSVWKRRGFSKCQVRGMKKMQEFLNNFERLETLNVTSL
jgi:hypothetical protein